MIAFVDPPTAKRTLRAFSTDLGVIILLGIRELSLSLEASTTACTPDASDALKRSA